jgi:hypothetical protein
MRGLCLVLREHTCSLHATATVRGLRALSTNATDTAHV